MKGEMLIMNDTGHDTRTWDSDDLASVKEAEAAFNKMMGGTRAAAYRMEGTKGEQIRKFDPNAETILIHQALSGG